jgi:hypothetical protein
MFSKNMLTPLTSYSLMGLKTLFRTNLMKYDTMGLTDTAMPENKKRGEI